MADKLGARLPMSARRDELDDLAVEINRTLDEIERLMIEAISPGASVGVSCVST